MKRFKIKWPQKKGRRSKATISDQEYDTVDPTTSLKSIDVRKIPLQVVKRGEKATKEESEEDDPYRALKPSTDQSLVQSTKVSRGKPKQRLIRREWFFCFCFTTMGVLAALAVAILVGGVLLIRKLDSLGENIGLHPSQSSNVTCHDGRPVPSKVNMTTRRL